MDTLRKQASRLREQVAKQQQAVIKQLSGSGYESSDVMIIDEVELTRHNKLEKLYRSTRSGKEFQKDIARGAEGLVAVGSKHLETGRRLCEDCLKYGTENSTTLARAASVYGDALRHANKEVEELNALFTSQVMEPMREMISDGALEDARHLAQRYSRMRQEAEAHVSEISKRKARGREAPSHENSAKLHVAELRMEELRQSMSVLGKEATTALALIESQQHHATLHRLLAMVEMERSYHERMTAILREAESEIGSDKQCKESALPVTVFEEEPSPDKTIYFLAQATHAFTAESQKELHLAVGDYVVVRKVVTPDGWSEGECNGKAGWFPSAYVAKKPNFNPS